MPTNPIILTTIVILKFVLPSHHSETHFPYKNLIIAQEGATSFNIFIFCLIIFRIIVVEKAQGLTIGVRRVHTHAYFY